MLEYYKLLIDWVHYIKTLDCKQRSLLMMCYTFDEDILNMLTYV